MARKMQKKGSYDRFVTIAFLFISALFASQHVSMCWVNSVLWTGVSPYYWRNSYWRAKLCKGRIINIIHFIHDFCILIPMHFSIPFSAFSNYQTQDKDLHNKRVPKNVITTLSSLCGAAFLYIGWKYAHIEHGLHARQCLYICKIVIFLLNNSYQIIINLIHQA